MIYFNGDSTLGNIESGCNAHIFVSNKAGRLIAIKLKTKNINLSKIDINKLLESLGSHENEYEIKTLNGEWWIFHKELGSGEPLKQWLIKKT